MSFDFVDVRIYTGVQKESRERDSGLGWCPVFISCTVKFHHSSAATAATLRGRRGGPSSAHVTFPIRIKQSSDGGRTARTAQSIYIYELVLYPRASHI